MNLSFLKDERARSIGFSTLARLCEARTASRAAC